MLTHKIMYTTCCTKINSCLNFARMHDLKVKLTYNTTSVVHLLLHIFSYILFFKLVIELLPFLHILLAYSCHLSCNE